MCMFMNPCARYAHLVLVLSSILYPMLSHAISVQTTEKSCIKAAAFVQVFNCLMRLLFKCGFYSRVAYMQCCESAKLAKGALHDVKCTVKVKLDFVNLTKLFQNANEHFGMQKAAEPSPTWTILDRHFQAAASIWVRLMCPYVTWVWRKCGFYSSAASNLVGLLYTTLRYMFVGRLWNFSIFLNINCSILYRLKVMSAALVKLKNDNFAHQLNNIKTKQERTELGVYLEVSCTHSSDTQTILFRLYN